MQKNIRLLKDAKKKVCIEILLFLLALSIGLFIRLYKLDTIPYGTNHDGAWGGLWAIELSQNPLPIQVFSNQSWLGEAMPRYVIALVIKFFGPTAFSLRLGVTLFSIIALPLLYLLVRYLFNNYIIAFFSIFLLAVSGWDMIYAKSGWATSSAPLFAITTSYFLIKAIKRKQVKDYLLTGFFLAMSFNTYRGSSLPFTISGVFLWNLFKNLKNWKSVLIHYLLFTLSFLLFVYPIANYAINNWEDYTARPKSLFVGYQIQQTGSLKPFWNNIIKAGQMYNIRGGGDDFFIKEPLLDFPTNYLFILGLIIGLLKIRQKKFAFLFLWFATALLPSLLGTPNGSHAIGTLPIIYIFAGLGLYEIFSYLKRIKPLANIYVPQLTAVFLLMFAFFTTYQLYLGPNRRELWGFYPETTVVGNYMKPRIITTDFYITDNYPRDALTLLTYQGGDPWIKHYNWMESKLSFLDVVPNPSKNTAFIMFAQPHNQQILDQLKTKFSQGVLTQLMYVDDNINRPAAWIFTLAKTSQDK